MQIIVGYLLILIGVGMEVVSVLVWLKVLKPIEANRSVRSATFWDVLLELTKRAPWTAVFGLLNIYAGLYMVGVELPF